MARKPLILLVDDDPASARHISSKFHEETGLNAIFAEDLDKAADYIDDPRLKFDALVSDISFTSQAQAPSRNLFDGLDLACYARKIRPDINIYILSVYADSSDEKERAKRLGLLVDGWYQKLNDGLGSKPPWLRIETALSGSKPSDGESNSLIGHDLFLAHCSADKPLVEAFALQLQQTNVEPWFDKWHMPAGALLHAEIERVMDNIVGVAVMFGPSGVGPWEVMEMRLAISSFVQRGSLVIPVILPGVKIPPEMPAMLRQFSWVDLSSGLEDPVELARIATAVRNARPNRKLP